MDQQDLVTMNKRLEDEFEMTRSEIDRLTKENSELKELRIQDAEAHNAKVSALIEKYQAEMQAKNEEMLGGERNYQELLQSQRDSHNASMMSAYRIIASIPTSIECDKESLNIECQKSKLRIAVSDISVSLDALYDVILRDGDLGVTKLQQMDQAKTSARTCENALTICAEMIVTTESSLDIDSLQRELVKSSIVSVKHVTSTLQSHITRFRGTLARARFISGFIKCAYGPKKIDIGELEIIRASLRELQKKMDDIPVIQGPTTAEKLEPQMISLTKIDNENLFSLEKKSTPAIEIGAETITEELDEDE